MTREKKAGKMFNVARKRQLTMAWIISST